MKREGKVRYLLLGAIMTALLTQLMVPTLAALAGKTIQVFTGVSIYVDDVKLNPKDANGNPVEAFVYNGTTYLPVRAVGEALDKVVQWDGATSSVYLGAHTGSKPAVWLKDLSIFNAQNGWGWKILENDKANTEETYTNALVAEVDSVSVTYLLNGQYSKMTGTFYQRHLYRAYDGDSYLKIYGDGELLYSCTMGPGTKPADFSIDLTGVLELKIVGEGMKNQYGTADAYFSAIGDCGLWT